MRILILGRLDLDSCQRRTSLRNLETSISDVGFGPARGNYYSSVVRPSQFSHPQVGARPVLAIFQRLVLSAPTTRRRNCRRTSCGRIARGLWPTEQPHLVTLPLHPRDTRLLSKGVRLTRCLPEIRDGISPVHYPCRDQS